MNYCKNCVYFSFGKHYIYGERQWTYYCGKYDWVIFNQEIKARLSFMKEDCPSYERKLCKKSYFDWLFHMMIPSLFSRDRESCSYGQYKLWNIDGRANNSGVGDPNSCIQEKPCE